MKGLKDFYILMTLLSLNDALSTQCVTKHRLINSYDT